MNRIIDEFKDLNRNPLSNCGVVVSLENDNNYRLWKATMLGPKDTSYSGGLFFLNIKFPEEYPLKAPVVYFVTPIYHLNIKPKASIRSEDEPLGYVFFSTLLNWKPEYNIRQVLVNIFALLYKPNPNNCYGLDRGEEFIRNRAAYDEKVKYFTNKYAHPNNSNKIYSRTEDWDFNVR